MEKLVLKEDERGFLQELIKRYGGVLAGARAREVYRIILDMVEKPLIEVVLEKTDGNQSKAAKILGMNRNTLHAKVRKLEIKVERFKYYY